MKSTSGTRSNEGNCKKSTSCSHTIAYKAIFSDDYVESIYAAMMISRRAPAHQKVPLTIELIEEVLELKAVEDSAYAIAEMLEVNSQYMNLNGALMPGSMETLFTWRKILVRLQAKYPGGFAPFEKVLVEDILREDRELFIEKSLMILSAGSEKRADKSDQYFETAAYLCRRGQHRKAQAYFAEASWRQGINLSRDITRLSCQLHHLNDADGIIEEAERWLSGFAEDPSHELRGEEFEKTKNPLSESEDDSLTLFELMQKHQRIQEFPGEATTIHDLCYRLFRAEALYLRGKEEQSIAQLVEVALSLKYSAETAALQGKGFIFPASPDVDEQSAQHIVAEMKDFCGTLSKTSNDAHSLEYVEWILSILDNLLLKQ